MIIVNGFAVECCFM